MVSYDSTEARPKQKLLLDISRLASRGRSRATPTGIDRVDLSYLRGCLRNPALEPQFLATTARGGRVLSRDQAEAMEARINEGWRSGLAVAGTAVFEQARRALEAPFLERSAPGCVRFKLPDGERERLASKIVAAFQFSKSTSPLKDCETIRLPRGEAMFLHTSHAQLDHHKRYAWLNDFRGEKSFFLHDALPNEYPEFCGPQAAARHERRLSLVSQCADRVIANSEATAQSLKRHCQSQNQRVPSTHVVPLGVADQFFDAHKVKPLSASIPYFVCVATLEPRKNHAFLFNLWRELVELMGEQAPRLVLVGHRGWENENIVGVLERSVSLRSHLIEVSGLHDEGLVSLLRGATALLAPSLAEGFDLPVAEALTVGTPVVASDIAAHREVAKTAASLLSPIDGRSWFELIVAASKDPTFLKSRGAEERRRYRALSVDRHMELAFAAMGLG